LTLITAEEWYDPDPDLRNYYQGDVLAEFPFPALPTFLPASRQDAWGILRPRQNRDKRPIAEVLRNLPNELFGRAAKDWPDAWSLPDGEHIIAGCKKMQVMIVSRSCDIDKLSRKHFLVAPVIPIDSLLEAQRTEEKLRDLRNNDIFHWFYLPAKGVLPESFADLTQMVPLHRSFFDDGTLGRNIVARLSTLGAINFQSALSDFYGIKFGFISTDTCPQAATYACASCFFSGQRAFTARRFESGVPFGDCAVCEADALWIKIMERG
jgi:hypothetical protein